MKIPYVLQNLAFFVLLAIASGDNCPGKRGCTAGQIGTSQYITWFLQCDHFSNCQSAIFYPSPNYICLIRVNDQEVRIYLSNCSEYSSNTGYFITDTANVLPSNKGSNSERTVFKYSSCGLICKDVELMKFKATTNDKLLIAESNDVATSSIDNCTRGLYFYPDASVKCGQAGPTGPTGPTRPCPSQTRQRAVLTITDGESVFAVGAPEKQSLESYRLPIVAEMNGEVLYVQEYSSRAVSANGTVERVTAYTLQLARSKKYLVADVLDDTTLNYMGPYSSGLNLDNASEYPGGYAREPDYRFFVQYNVTIYNQTATVFCPLFHRNHCLYPGVSGYLRLTPIKHTDRSLQPTFENPTDDVLRHYVLYSQSPESGRWLHVKFSFL